MKLKARQKSFKQNGKDIIFDEVYALCEPVKGYPFELVISLDKNARQVVVQNLENAELVVTPSQFVNDNGEIINYTNVSVKVGSYDFSLKKKLGEAEKFLIKMASGLLVEKK